MRSLRKNKQKMYYSMYEGQKTLYAMNDDGSMIYADDECTIPIEKGATAQYGKPIEFDANASAGKGSAYEDVFGTNVDYTRTISTSDLSIPINELSVVWIETAPEYMEDGSVNPNSADYKVAARPAKSLNHLVIALKALPKGSV